MTINNKVCEVTIYTTECDLKYCMEMNPNLIEVVRCKDCIHYGSDGGALMVCDVSDMVVDDTDYCSYGERREE